MDSDDLEPVLDVTPLNSDLGNLIYQGAEAKVYDGVYLNRPAIIKERFSKKYRHPDLDDTIIKDRMKFELRCMVRASSNGIRVPNIYFVDSLKNRIVMEKIENSVALREYICGHLAQTDTTILSSVANAIGSIVGNLHANQILHGDLTTSNMLVKIDCDGCPLLPIQLILIDFGLGVVESNKKVHENKAVDLYVLERALLSTHPNTQQFFEIVLLAYKNSYKEAQKVILKLDEIRLRGRKRDMIG